MTWAMVDDLARLSSGTITPHTLPAAASVEGALPAWSLFCSTLRRPNISREPRWPRPATYLRKSRS